MLLEIKQGFVLCSKDIEMIFQLKLQQQADTGSSPLT